MVGDYSDGMSGAENVVTPFCESENDCKEFIVIDIMILFRRCKSTRKISTRMKIFINISLKEDSTSSKERGISHNRERTGNIRDS